MGGNMGRFSAGGHNSSSSMNLQDEMNNFSGGMMQGRGMMGMDSSRFGDSNDLDRNPGGRGMMGMDSSSGFRSSKDPWKEEMEFGNDSRFGDSNDLNSNP